MAIDRKLRDDLRDALIRYMTGEIRSFAFADHVWPLRFRRAKSITDKSVHQIARFLYCIYDSLIDHPVSASPQVWAALRRILAFLQTDLEIEKTWEQDTWPFRDEEEWLQNEKLLSGISLPEYDPEVHGRPANPWWNRIPSSVGFAILGGILVVVVILLLLA
jgi:hypothetical protein